MVVVLFAVRAISQYVIHFQGDACCHLWNDLRCKKREKKQTNKKYNIAVWLNKMTETTLQCHVWGTWMAPRFSVSWLGLEDPRSTELTPSFLKHQARRKEFLGLFLEEVH